MSSGASLVQDRKRQSRQHQKAAVYLEHPPDLGIRSSIPVCGVAVAGETVSALWAPAGSNPSPLYCMFSL